MKGWSGMEQEVGTRNSLKGEHIKALCFITTVSFCLSSIMYILGIILRQAGLKVVDI